MIDALSQKHKDRLAPYLRKILEGLIPILERLDPSQLSPESYFGIEMDKQGHFGLRLKVIPADENISILDLAAYPDGCVLSYAGGEQIEAYNIRSDLEEHLVNRVLTKIEKYLNGITVMEQYNRKNKLVKKVYFSGIDTEQHKEMVIGRSIYLTVPRKIYSVVKRTYRFLK